MTQASTRFLSADRDPKAHVEKQTAELFAVKLLTQLLNAAPEILVGDQAGEVLNLRV